MLHCSLLFFPFLQTENEEKHKETVSSLESQKESLVQQLQTLQKVLDRQIEKFKEQVCFYFFYFMLPLSCFSLGAHKDAT